MKLRIFEDSGTVDICVAVLEVFGRQSFLRVYGSFDEREKTIHGYANNLNKFRDDAILDDAESYQKETKQLVDNELTEVTNVYFGNVNPFTGEHINK